MSITRRQSAGSNSQVFALPPVMPALFTRMSIFPNAATVASVAAWTEARLARSTVAVCTVPGVPISAEACASAAASTSQSETRAPEARRRSAMARPMPRAPPVTTALRSVRSILFMIRWVRWRASHFQQVADAAREEVVHGVGAVGHAHFVAALRVGFLHRNVPGPAVAVRGGGDEARGCELLRAEL